MRWGVGKGRFRMVTAIFLCFVLAGLFLIVWTYYQQVKPLTIDTSPAARTATISDRLLHHETYNVDSLTESEIIHFITIADSVHAIFSLEFDTLLSSKNSVQEKVIHKQCVNAQEDIKKFIGLYLNQHYISGEEYRTIEQRILATLNHDWLTQTRTRSEREMLDMSFIRSVSDSLMNSIDTIGVTEHDQRLVREFSRYLQHNLFPFYTGFTSDVIMYHSLKVPHSQGATTK